MMFNKTMIKALSLILFISISGVSFIAKAVPITCTGDYAFLLDSFNGESACQIGEDNNDNMGGSLDVNTHMMFGQTDWEFITGVNLNAGMGGDEYSLSEDFLDFYSDIMIVFKGPGENSGSQPWQYVGYLLDQDDNPYSWINEIFMKEDGSGFHGISHINLYAIEDGGGTGNCFPECPPPPPPPPVPEPQTLLIFVTALLGLIITRKKIVK